MAEVITVPAVVAEKTYVGKVNFPASVPVGLVDLFAFPDDVFKHAAEMGLNDRAVKFIMAILGGRWALSASVDLQDIAIKTGMKYDDMDAIVRDLVAKNYASLGERLDIYRLWIALLHVMGVRFVQE
jgi:hypothetical protein